MDKKSLQRKKMEWAIGPLEKFDTFWRDTAEKNINFLFEVVRFSAPEAVLIIGQDNANQFQDNIKIINTKSYNKSDFEKWWLNLPQFPERVLNPSLW